METETKDSTGLQERPLERTKPVIPIPSRRYVYDRARKRVLDRGNKLKPKHKLFADEYVSNGGNASEACRAAGIGKKGREGQNGWNVLHREDVQAYLSSINDASSIVVLDSKTVSNERVLDEESKIAFFDPRVLFRDDGSLVPPPEWPEDVARCVSGIDIKEHRNREGHITYEYRVRFWSKGDSLNRIQKVLGMQVDKKHIEGDLTLRRLLDEIDDTHKDVLPAANDGEEE